MDIYDIYDQLISILTQNNLIVTTSKIFKLCTTNADKVKFIEKLLHKYDLIPQHNSQSKDNCKSQELRQKGNKLFVSGKFFNALELYNESICWAAFESEDLAIGYANRSAVYQEWKMYDMCLENIKLAKASGYPKRLMDKLHKRERECLEQINNSSDILRRSTEFGSILKLGITANTEIPFIANCLEMKECKDQGRYIITNKELEPGTFIITEEPYAVVLQMTYRYHRCAYCMIENNLSLIPCPNCVNTMFCSEECLSKAYKEFHQFECPITDYFLVLFNKIHMSALRVSLKAVCSFDCVEDMIEFCRENESSNITPYSFDHRKGLSSVQQYQQIHSLATNEDKRSPSDLFQRGCIVAMLYHKLMKYTKLADILKTNAYEAAFIEILFRHSQTAPTNYHTLGLAETPIMEGIDYGAGAYPFCSLLNHSCAPNVCRMSVGTKIFVFALRLIKKGEQLFDNYSHHHYISNKSNRQRALNLQYNFICNCEACTFDYANVLELSAVSAIQDIQYKMDEEKLTNLDSEFALENLPRFCKYLKDFDKYYPCIEIGRMQENMKMCFHILAENYSFKTKTEKCYP